MSFPTLPAPMDAFLAFAPLVVLKTTLLLAVVTLFTFLLRRQSAGLRHLLWASAIAAIVLLPAIAALSPVRLPLLPASAAEPGATDRPSIGEPGPDQRAADPTPVSPSREAAAPSATGTTTSRSPVSRTTILVVLWLAGVLAVLSRFAMGLRRIRDVVRRAAPVEDLQWIGLADRARVHARPFELRISDEVSMPFATGVLTPAVVLPADSLDWSVERREVVLQHELAHLNHGDLFMNALSHLARALYWFNPLAWYASHRLRIEAERACDDAVLRRGARASDYADHLLSIASGMGASRALPSAALAMARPTAFEGRLLAILEPGLDRAALSRGRALATIAAFVAVILPLAAAAPAARATAMPPSEEAAETISTEVATQSETRTVPGTTAAQLPQASERASSAAPALIETLSDASATVRLAAVQSLGTLQDPRAIAALGKVLKEDSDSRVRQAAAHALGEIDDPRAVPHLLDALRGETVPAVREAIVRALGEIDDPSAVGGVAAAARDANLSVRRAVADALREFEDQAALPTLITMARDEDAEVRASVADALGNLENPSAFEPLVTLAKDRNAEVRAEAIDALGSLEDRRALSVFVAALADDNAEVRSQAADAIQGLDDLETAPKALIDALEDPDRDVRQNVAQALGNIGDEAAVPALKKLLADPNAEMRRTVAEALADIGGAEAVTALMALLKDQDPEIRRIAAQALGKRR